MSHCRIIMLPSLLVVAGSALSLCFAQSAPIAPASNGSGGATVSAPAPGVQVTSHGDQLQVKVPDQAPLSMVMSSLCQQQKLKCTGMETLANYRGPAMSVEGTLRQVIAKLVEGTDINYEFSRSAEGGATAIAFLGHAPKGTAPVPTAEQPAPVAPARPLHSRPFPGKVPPEAGPPPETTPQPQSQLVQPEAGGNANTQAATVGTDAGKLLAIGSGGTDSGVLPFSDAQGNPIRKSDAAPTVLPFPDQYGNPIPVKPTAAGSPFPPAKPSPSKSSTQN